MKNVEWWAQNEDTNEDGCLLQGEEAFEAERACLAAMGAPDTDQIVFSDIVPEDRDTALCTAQATEAFAAWLKAEDIGPWEDEA